MKPHGIFIPAIFIQLKSLSSYHKLVACLCNARICSYNPLCFSQKISCCAKFSANYEFLRDNYDIFACLQGGFNLRGGEESISIAEQHGELE